MERAARECVKVCFKMLELYETLELRFGVCDAVGGVLHPRLDPAVIEGHDGLSDLGTIIEDAAGLVSEAVPTPFTAFEVGIREEDHAKIPAREDTKVVFVWDDPHVGEDDLFKGVDQDPRGVAGTIRLVGQVHLREQKRETLATSPAIDAILGHTS